MVKPQQPVKPGKFITVEGTEGVGKTTNIAYIEHWLTTAGVDFISTREPGGTPLGERLRTILLEPQDTIIDETAELLMIFAARAQHLREVIVPALKRGQWVLCDRFTDATYAYQGGGRMMDKNTIGQLERLVQNHLRPDAVLFLDMPVALGLARAKGRGNLDRFEQEDLAFFERVREAYHQRAQENQNYFIIDATPALADVQTQLASALTTIQEVERNEPHG